MKAKQIYIPVSILAVGLLLMLFLLDFRNKPEKRKLVVRPKIVNAITVNLHEVESQVEGYGRLTTSQPVILYSEVTGILQKGNVNFQSAGSFKKGDLLIKVDDRQAVMDLNSAKSDFLNALASVLPEIKVDYPAEFKTWQTYFNHCDFDKNLQPLPKPENRKIKYYLTRFNVYKLYYTVKNLEIRHEKHFFYAPFNGSIVSADLHAGSSVRTGSKIGEIINLQKLEVEVPVAAKDLQWIDYSKTVRLQSTEIDKQWRGKVLRIGKDIDQRTQTVQVFIGIDKYTDELINGLFLRVVIPGKKIPGAFTLPSRAVYKESYVYRIKNKKLDYLKIDVVRRQLEDIIITGNIRDGDTLVTDLLQGVSSGMPANALIAKSSGGNN